MKKPLRSPMEIYFPLRMWIFGNIAQKTIKLAQEMINFNKFCN